MRRARLFTFHVSLFRMEMFMLGKIDLDAIPSGETRAALLILAGRLQALTDQVTGFTGNITGESGEPAAAPKQPRKPATQRTRTTTK